MKQNFRTATDGVKLGVTHDGINTGTISASTKTGGAPAQDKKHYKPGWPAPVGNRVF